MKTLLLSSISLLALGTVALVFSQDDKSPSTPPETSAAIEATDVAGETTAPASLPPAIRTDAVIERTLGNDDRPVVTVPVASVFVEEETFFVLAKGAESDIDFRQVQVTLGKTDGLFAEVTEGLSVGDEVVTVTMLQVRAPAFGDEDFGACVTECSTTCETECSTDCKDGSCKAGTCKDGTCSLESCKDGKCVCGTAGNKANASTCEGGVCKPVGKAAGPCGPNGSPVGVGMAHGCNPVGPGNVPTLSAVDFFESMLAPEFGEMIIDAPPFAGPGFFAPF